MLKPITRATGYLRARLARLFRRKSDLVIRRVLDLSTVHLREVTCAGLNSYDGVRADDTEYGWLMYAPKDADECAAEYEWPEELLPIVKLARANGCTHVLFDQDGDCTELLPTFDW